ncbi:hypothetical protein K7X08_011054 [Anisodus acutangulus]|uniref:Uncharacterized protein n=1 Tax=Anisodus acutangulus TaxID=402998 RepID=A0A9Q1LZ90_9SOLA|nr:hypothetical protein K7X08_011054 [Anisodus acutangulus]
MRDIKICELYQGCMNTALTDCTTKSYEQYQVNHYNTLFWCAMERKQVLLDSIRVQDSAFHFVIYIEESEIAGKRKTCKMNNWMIYLPIQVQWYLKNPCRNSVVVMKAIDKLESRTEHFVYL